MPKKRKTPSNETMPQNKHGLLRMRCDNGQKGNGAQQTHKKAKTSVLIRESKIEQKGSPSKRDRLRKKLATLFSAIPSHRPVAQILTSSPDGTPTEVATEDGSRLTLRDNNGLVHLYSNQPFPASPEKITRLKNKAVFLTSSPAKNVKQNRNPKPSIQRVITLSSLDDAIHQIKQNQGRRIKNQNQVMAREGVIPQKASANRYAKATKAFPDDFKWEWAHFIAHRFEGDKSQDPDNIACGTKHFNTEMMFAEYQIPNIAKAYPEGFSLNVEPTYLPGTHILQSIDYKIITRDFTLCFHYDAQKSKKPDFVNYYYTTGITNALLDLSRSPPSSPKKSSAKDNTLLFFSPAKKADKNKNEKNLDDTAPSMTRRSRHAAKA